jgi:GntR family transcriptional repressor for pyruvate dehydrogenase complex
LYEVIVEQLCLHIADNEMVAGDRLPPERDLAAKLGVSRASLSQALVALEVRRCVRSARRSHAPTVEEGQSGVARRGPPPDIIEARGRSVKIAGLAADAVPTPRWRHDAAISAMEAESLWRARCPVTTSSRRSPAAHSALRS